MSMVCGHIPRAGHGETELCIEVQLSPLGWGEGEWQSMERSVRRFETCHGLQFSRVLFIPGISYQRIEWGLKEGGGGQCLDNKKTTLYLYLQLY